MGVFESSRMRWIPRSERIWPPRPMARRMRPVRACEPSRVRSCWCRMRLSAVAAETPSERAVPLQVEGRGNGGSLVDVEAARSVVEVEDCAAAFFRNHAHGLVEDFAAMAVGGEDVAGGAARVHANQNGMRARRARCAGISGDVCRTFMARGATGAQVAADEGDVAFAAVDLAFVGDHAELAVFRLNAGFAGADDVALVAQAVADEFGDSENAQIVLGAERDQVGNAGHFAVVAHDFADDAGGLQAGEARQIDRGLGLASAHQNAALAGTQREDVAGAHEIGGGRFGVDGGADGVSAVGCGDACGDAFTGFNGLSEGGSETRGVLLRHGEQTQMVGTLIREREANEAPAVAGHEVDGLGRNVLRSEGQVALVLAVFVIDDDDHAAGADLGDGARDVGEG